MERKDLHKAIEAALLDADSARQQLAEELLSVDFDTFSKTPASTFLQLGQKELIELLRARFTAAVPILNAVRSEQPQERTPSEHGFRGPGPRQRAWLDIDPAIRGSLRGIAFGMAAAVMVLLLQTVSKLKPDAEAMPIESSRWPRCQRLSSSTDACVYWVRRGLSWHDASSYLLISESTLRRYNPQLAHHPQHLTAGVPLVVWRGKRALK